jgi:hypothetical protein
MEEASLVEGDVLLGFGLVYAGNITDNAQQ